MENLFGQSLVGTSDADTLTGGNEAVTLLGNGGNDVLNGGDGNDTLEGGAGVDTMFGGAGNDLYVVDAPGDVVTEAPGAGTDTVISATTFGLGANVENLTLIGSANLNATGNVLNNLISGNSGNNSLDGGQGDDRLEGGDGADTLSSGEGSDTLLGGNGDDVILSGAYSDGDHITKLIDGDQGTDRLEIDFYVADAVRIDISNPGSTAHILIGGAIRGSIDNVEQIDISTGLGSDSIVGGDLADTIFGGIGDDTIHGGGGDDLLFGSTGEYGAPDDDLIDGGSGSDTVSYRHTGTEVSINLNLQGMVQDNGLGGGADMLIGIENIEGSRYGDMLIGDDNANYIDGYDGSDLIDGRSGDDDLYISSSFGNVQVTLLGGDGDDRIRAYLAEHVTIDGGDGDDKIIALVENAVIDAGAGDDMVTVDLRSTDTRVTLGAGADIVRLFQTARSYNGGSHVMADFETGDGGDIFDLASYASNPVLTQVSPGVNLFATGHFRLEQSGADTLFRVDVDGSAFGGYSSVTVLVFQNRNVDDFTAYNLAGQHPGQINLIMGTSGNDVLTGTALGDRFDGGSGNDTMSGGLGDDQYHVDEAGDIVIEAAEGGNDSVTASLAYTLTPNVENLVLTGSANFNGTGNTLSNSITGNSGNNSLSGGDGDDTLMGGNGNDTLNGGAWYDSLIGGAGDDSYIVDEGGLIFHDTVIENADEGTDTITASVGYALPDNVENLIFTGIAAIDGFGNDLANLLTGNAAANQFSGGNGNDTIRGGAGGDNLIGGNGDDLLDGGADRDTLVGGGGNDTYIIDDVGNLISEAPGGGTDTVLASISFQLAPIEIENLTLTGTGAINGTGNNIANLITGNSGNNILDGREGADTLAGGAGNDSYIVDSEADIIVEADNGGTDTVTAATSYALGTNVENLILTGQEDIDGTGNAVANVITGNGSDNVLGGNAGNDTLSGGGGGDTLDGGLGNDSMAGGLGDDTYVVDVAADLVDEAVNAGTDTVKASITYTLGANVENLTLTGSAAINGTGNAGNNAINGNASNNSLDGADGADTLVGGSGNDTLNGGNGNDTLNGGEGVDSLTGGLGNDTYLVDNTSDVIVEAANAGTDTVSTTTSYVLGANVENLTLTGGEDIDGTGNAAANVITGNAGDNALSGAAGNDTLNGGAGGDTLDGGAGTDSMVGGVGNDVYVIDAATDIVVEAVSAGTDTVEASITYTLGANVENLTLRGSAAINGTGNASNNVITGNSANNLLNGAAGNDTLEGGAGNDTLDGGIGADSMSGGNGNDSYTVDNVGDEVVENEAGGTDTVNSSASYMLGANVENVTLTGTANINATGNDSNNIVTGNIGNNALAGGAGNDTLNGGAGNDTLDGGEGNDSMVGGAGNDTYVVNNAGDVVVEAASAGIDSVTSSVTHILAINVESLTLTGEGAINGTGNASANLITGNAGNNLLSGAAGNDTLNGGDGNDTLDGGANTDSMVGGAGDDNYVVNVTGDVIVEGIEGGTDHVTSSVTYTLGTNVENLTLSGTTAINGTGNGGANVITGNAANNNLVGGEGNDTLNGGNGNDTLNGGTGNDMLNGGAGNDSMAGGAGDDSYVVDSATDIVTEAVGAGTDSISASITVALAANVENLTLTGSANINGTGNGGNNALIGNSSNNMLTGGNGNDTLDGGLGVDTLLGGAGGDSFQFSTVLSGANIDAVNDFNAAFDLFRISRDIFGGIDAGFLSIDRFRVGTAASDEDDRIIYNDTTGGLFYDRDGSGDTTAQQFAQLNGFTGALSFGNFFVF